MRERRVTVSCLVHGTVKIYCVSSIRRRKEGCTCVRANRKISVQKVVAVVPKMDLVGRRFGWFVVDYEAPSTFYYFCGGKQRRRWWHGKCFRCEGFGTVRQSGLISGKTKSCGCLQRDNIVDLGYRTRFKDLTGQLIGRWKVKRRIGKEYVIECVCGRSRRRVNIAEVCHIRTRTSQCRVCEFERRDKEGSPKTRLRVPIGKFMGHVKITGSTRKRVKGVSTVFWKGICQLSLARKLWRPQDLISGKSKSGQLRVYQLATEHYFRIQRAAELLRNFTIPLVLPNQQKQPQHIMKKQTLDSYEQFMLAYRKGIEGWTEAGVIAAAEIKRTRGKWAKSLNKIHPEISVSITLALARVGRNELIAELLAPMTPGERVLRECSYEAQKKHFYEPVKVVFRKAGGWVTKLVHIQSMDDDIITQVFDNGIIRSESEQRSYIEKLDEAGDDSQHPESEDAVNRPGNLKNFWKHVATCKKCNDRVQKIKEHMEAGRVRRPASQSRQKFLAAA